MKENTEKNKETGCSVINFKVPKEMGGMIEKIRVARAARFEETSNTAIAKDALKALYSKVVKKD